MHIKEILRKFYLHDDDDGDGVDETNGISVFCVNQPFQCSFGNVSDANVKDGDYPSLFDGHGIHSRYEFGVVKLRSEEPSGDDAQDGDLIETRTNYELENGLMILKGKSANI